MISFKYAAAYSGENDDSMQHFGKAQEEQSVINLSIAFSALSGDIISNYAYSKGHCSLKDIGH